MVLDLRKHLAQKKAEQMAEKIVKFILVHPDSEYKPIFKAQLKISDNPFDHRVKFVDNETIPLDYIVLANYKHEVIEAVQIVIDEETNNDDGNEGQRNSLKGDKHDTKRDD